MTLFLEVNYVSKLFLGHIVILAQRLMMANKMAKIKR